MICIADVSIERQKLLGYKISDGFWFLLTGVLCIQGIVHVRCIACCILVISLVFMGNVCLLRLCEDCEFAFWSAVKPVGSSLSPWNDRRTRTYSFFEMLEEH